MGLIRCSLLCVGLLLTGGCTRANPDYCDADSPCAGEQVCDLEGVLGNRNACVPPVCAPGEVLSCDGEEAEVCTDDRLGTAVETCEFGCNDDGCAPCPAGGRACRELEPGVSEVAVCAGDGSVIDQRECVLGCFDDQRCTDVDPSNDLELDLDMIDRELAAIGDLILEDGYTVHSDGTITDGADQQVPVASFQLRPQAGGPMMTVFHARSIEITGEVLLTGPDVIAFVAIGDITIDGTLIVRSGGLVDPINGCVGDAGTASGLDASGSGGGGYESSGGNGGDADTLAGGPGGQSVAATSALIPLKAGCAGGGEMGGDGGGGLQLVSRSRIVVTADAGINAGGAGGSAPVGPAVSPAGGGGSGGGVLLEAPVIDIAESGFVAANGGGGACVAPSEVKPGADGLLAATQAPGGNCLVNNSGRGGAGGAKAGLREDGQDQPGGSVDAGGGGGGSVGRIRVNSVLGAPSSSRFSPDPALGTLDTR